VLILPVAGFPQVCSGTKVVSSKNLLLCAFLMWFYFLQPQLLQPQFLQPQLLQPQFLQPQLLQSCALFLGDASSVPGDAGSVPGDASTVPGDASSVPGDAVGGAH